MELLLVKSVAALVLPPGGNFVLGLVAVLLWRRARMLAASLAALSVLALLIFSTPQFADALFAGLESHEPRLPGTPVAADVGAVVVLSGGRSTNAWEYGGETVSSGTLERARYGARLQRETGLPLLVSGGSVFGGTTPEAELMREALEVDFNVPVRWLEDRSRNTVENAQFTAELLAKEGVRGILLVTHAMHMPRSVAAFEERGMRVYPAPTGFRSGVSSAAGLLNWLPSAGALEKSSTALHEYLGRWWYALRY